MKMWVSNPFEGPVPIIWGSVQKHTQERVHRAQSQAGEGEPGGLAERGGCSKEAENDLGLALSQSWVIRSALEELQSGLWKGNVEEGSLVHLSVLCTQVLLIFRVFRGFSPSPPSSSLFPPPPFFFFSCGLKRTTLLLSDWKPHIAFRKTLERQEGTVSVSQWTFQVPLHPHCGESTAKNDLSSACGSCSSCRTLHTRTNF